MELPNSTPIRINNRDRFKARVDAANDLMDYLRPTLYESPEHYKAVDAASIMPETAPPKAQVTHYVSHALTGLLTLAESDQPTLGTAREILALREKTANAFRQVHFEFGENTEPRDLLSRLDMQMNSLFDDAQYYVDQIKGPNSARVLGQDRSGRSID